MGNRAWAEDVRRTMKRFFENVPNMKRTVGDPSRIDNLLLRLKEDHIEWKKR